MGEVALALMLASVVTASLFLGLRAPKRFSRDPHLDRALTSYSEALGRLRGTFDEADGRPLRHPAADLADYLDRRSDAPRR
jgi:hypothetical protein